MVEEDALVTELLGVTLARCPVPEDGVVDARHQMLLVREAIRQLSSTPHAVQKRALKSPCTTVKTPPVLPPRACLLGNMHDWHRYRERDGWGHVLRDCWG